MSIDLEAAKLEAPVCKQHVHTGNEQQPLRNCVLTAMRNYFSQLDGEMPANLYELVLAEIEIPLLEAVLQYTQGNQSRAAILLGISRGTLRKKLDIYNLE